MKFNIKFFLSQIIIFLIISNVSLAEIVKKIEVIGNVRISSETIKSFSSIKINDDIDENTINASLKSLYESNFFKNVNIKFKQNTLIIEVVENPIIQNLNLDGVKSQRIRDNIFNNLNLKPRGSFFEKNKIKDINLIKSLSKDLGYYFACRRYKEILDDNKVNITFKVDFKKAKINKISYW